MKLVELQQDEIIVKFKDLNRLFDSVEYFKPLTIKSYAAKKGISVQAVHKSIKNERLCTIIIDSITFVLE